MPQLTLGWLTLLNTQPPDVITAAAEAGFKSVSIRITGRKLGDDFMKIVGNKPVMQDLKKRLKDGGLRLSNTSVYHMSPDITLDDVRPAIEASAELGAAIMVATCTDQDHARWTQFIGRVCEEAGKHGLKVALEFVPFSQCRTIEAGSAIVRNVGASNFGLLIDPLHLARSGGSPADIGKVDPKHIVFVQLCDAAAKAPPFEGLPNEARTGRFYPGDGALPLYDFLDALPPGIEIECEMPRIDFEKLPAAEQAKRSHAALQTYLGAYCAKRGKPAWI
jgi:sugar phosphate isomerase/epimerase